MRYVAAFDCLAPIATGVYVIQTFNVFFTFSFSMHLDLLGVKPYTHQMKQIRAQRLAKAYPQYSKDLLISYSLSSPFYDAKKLWFPV
jgi:hypothetical protein